MKRRLTDFAHEWVANIVKPGDMVVDATVGNGHDTLFLANLVGPRGRVIGFDIQENAISLVRKKLEEAGVLDCVALHRKGHEHLDQVLSERPKAIMFNLGYLPGGSKSVTTLASTTITALQQALQRLDDEGLLTIIAYPGHKEGKEEEDAIDRWLKTLPSEKYTIQRINAEGMKRASPVLYIIKYR